jgi:superfamily I DNA and RNA helicase
MACEDNNIKRLDFREAASKNRKDPFGEVCDMLIKSDTISPKYDLILIDEGQDFTPPFYQLCYKLSKNRKIVWAYDDFQNIFDVDIQDEKLTFGSENGEPSVDFDSSDNSNQDIVLKKCYRTPRIQLIAAFSLGLGIYNDKVLQCIDSKQLWESLGFEVLKGNCVTGDSMEIIRPENNTPQISNKIFKYSSFQTISCHDIVHECMEIAKCITRDVTEENLLPTDICVICLDKKNVHEYFDKIEGYLMRDDIRCFNLLNVVNSNISFTRDGCVTLTTVNKAKGNEKGAVYICGVDYVFSNANNVVLRNMLFTSMTRTKGWLTLTGSGDDFEKCLQEINRLRDNEFKLRFCQPSKEETKTIESNSRKQESAFGSIQQQIDLLKKSGLSIEDIKNRFSRMLDSNHES